MNLQKTYNGIWFLIHRRAITATNEDIDQVPAFYSNIIALMVCDVCRNDSQKYMTDNPVNITSQEALFQWTVTWHNHVNQKLRKTIYSFKQASAAWTVRQSVVIKTDFNSFRRCAC